MISCLNLRIANLNVCSSSLQDVAVLTLSTFQQQRDIYSQVQLIQALLS
jgi:hypothetical protein